MEKRICWECVGNPFLASEIQAGGEQALCSYCNTRSSTFALGAVADRVAVAFDAHFTRTSVYPNSWEERLHHDSDSNYEWERSGLPVAEAIENAAAISPEAASDVQKLLEARYFNIELAKMNEETEFSSDSYYDEKGNDGWEWHEEWYRFEKSLKTEARFFSRAAAQHLTAVFGCIDQLRTRDGDPLVIDAGPGHDLKELFRARVFQNEDKLLEALCSPDMQLGSPPSGLARAGRMNAHGISVFYGANLPEVAIAEVRPVVGSTVAVAKFSIIRNLRLLDLTTLEKVQVTGDIFDPSYVKRLERAQFLRSLGKRMTRPVMPGDEDMDYLATQACADFLATENVPILDGIIFSSVQARGGRNIVLFHNAAKSELLELPEGTQIAATSGHSTEDGWEVDYTVRERMPPPSWKLPEQTRLLEPFDGYEPEVVTLRIDPHSLVVHHVDWVEYRCTGYPVDRARYQGNDSEIRGLSVDGVAPSDTEF